MSRRVLTLAASLLLLVPVAACTDKSSSADTTTSVTGTDDSCKLAKDSLPAGGIDFDFRNDGSKVSELYVFRENGDIVGEVENVAPGTSRTLTANLVAGQYEVVCKPGQKGDGIAADFTVTGEGGNAPVAPDRTITFDAVDFSYEDLDLKEIAPGDTIRFEMTNSGKQPHEFEVLDPQAVAIGEVAAVDAGGSGGANVTFEEPGTYTYQCILVDEKTGKKHTMLGMTGTFEVAA